MKSFFKSLKRQGGFTLVELMVVVAIIGLLSAVAVPNFKKYQAKAKISEAKLQLSAAYTAEQSFFSDFNIYHHCLTYMGFDPGPEFANRYYMMGFQSGMAAIDTTAFNAAVNSGLDSTPTGCPNAASAAAAGVGATSAGNSANNTSQFNAGKGIGSNIANTNAHLPLTSLGTQTATGTMLFTLGAAGVIAGDFTTNANCSALTIRQDKVLSLVRNGY